MPRSKKKKNSFKRDEKGRAILGSAKEMAEWVKLGFDEQDKKKDIVLKDCSIMPIMVASINTLYLYDTLLAKRGLCNVVDMFLKDYAKYDSALERYDIAVLADFDAYLRRNSYKKSGDAVRWLKRNIKQIGVEDCE